MQQQHTIDDHPNPDRLSTRGIGVPLDLPELKILDQRCYADGSIEVHVIATTDRETCPFCKKICVKIHDIRRRKKRDTPLRTYRVHLILYKRRFRCTACQRTFTETDSICGKYKPTTRRFRKALAKQAEKRSIAHIAQEMEGGPRFVEECFEESMTHDMRNEIAASKQRA
jgi:transposase